MDRNREKNRNTATYTSIVLTSKKDDPDLEERPKPRN